MSRDLSVAVAAASSEEVVPALLLIELDFASGFVRVNNSAIDMTWNGQVWTGLAAVGAIDAISENTDMEMSGVRMTLSGIPNDMISTALGEHYQGRACNIWLAPLDADFVVLADPVLVFPGRMDTMSMELGSTATITLTAENRMADWNRARVRRYTNEDQQAAFPGDRGLEFVPQMAEKTLVWGRT